jgi:hypothetical protein
MKGYKGNIPIGYGNPFRGKNKTQRQLQRKEQRKNQRKTDD